MRRPLQVEPRHSGLRLAYRQRLRDVRLFPHVHRSNHQAMGQLADARHVPLPMRLHLPNAHLSPIRQPERVHPVRHAWQSAFDRRT